MRRGPRDAHRSVRGLRGDPVRLARARRPPLGVVVLGLLAYVPALTAGRGRMPADTKLYLYLDPGRLVSDAPYTFDGRQFAGWVPHQTISYLWPSGPWYWLFDAIGVPDWIAHRLWIGTILFVAGLGVRWLARLLGIVGSAAARRGGCVPAVAIRAAVPLTYLADAAAVRRPRLDHRPHGARRATRVVAARRAARAGRRHGRSAERDGDRDDRAGAGAVVGARGVGWRDQRGAALSRPPPASAACASRCRCGGWRCCPCRAATAPTCSPTRRRWRPSR